MVLLTLSEVFPNNLGVMLDLNSTVDPKVTLLGGGPLNSDDLPKALALAPRIVAADGGASHARAHRLPLSQIIGDLDSLDPNETWQEQGTEILRVDEQDSTDFEKCLQHLEAKLVIALGFLGGRLDHALACLNALTRHPDTPTILLGEIDLVFLAPLKVALNLPIGTRFSLMPMGACKGLASDGLKWPIRGLDFAPNGQIGTSNETTQRKVTAQFDAQNMLVILPKGHLETVVASLT